MDRRLYRSQLLHSSTAGYHQGARYVTQQFLLRSIILIHKSSYASDSGVAVACGPFRLLVRPHLVRLSDIVQSPEVLTGARLKLHLLPSSLNAMVVA